jgi:NDP-sugar pyrophosphorylase family protein
MQVVILAGGLGTRLRGVAGDLPKSLVPVAGQPFIERQFELLARHGFRNVLLCLGYRGELIQAHVGNGARFGMEVSYSHEDPLKLLGTGGALINARQQLEESFMVMYGDSYLPVDYRAVAVSFADDRVEALMCVYRNQGLWDASNVRIEGDRVVFYSKTAKPGEADYIDYGLSLFRRTVLESYVGQPLPLDLARIQGDLVRRGEMRAFIAQERPFEVGKPEGIADLECQLTTREPSR